jgi:hypothetical protein
LDAGDGTWHVPATGAGFRCFPGGIDWQVADRGAFAAQQAGSGMGVRFQCPQGHKLHVKAELAGKRGICPECGAKFVVPAFNGGRVAEDASAAPATGAASSPSTSLPASPAASVDPPGGSVFIQTQTPPSVAPPAAATAPSPAANHEPIAWYVRPAAGGQFGPATTEVFQKWIEDGRVAVDSWVWRTGWADWKAGGEALAQIPDRLSSEPSVRDAAPEMPGVAPVVTTQALVGAAAHIEPASAEIRRAEIKRRKDRVRTLSTVLALVALAMLMALVFVLAR